MEISMLDLSDYTYDLEPEVIFLDEGEDAVEM